MMKSNEKKLPGKGARVLSFIPVFNCFALIYIGAANGNLINVICGIAYFIISMAIPQIAFLFWIACIIQYSVSYQKIKSQVMNFPDPIAPPKTTAYNSTVKNNRQFSDLTLPGNQEHRQSIPVRPSYDSPSVTVPFSYESSQDKFFKDMKKHENRIGSIVPFEPFMTYWPTYDSMTKGQLNWFFYWRTEVRKQNYIDTDLSYIFIYIYELLSEVGWKTPQEGYDKLVGIWQAYQERFPKLNGYLNDWTSDFANVYGLECTKTVKYDSLRLPPSVQTDLLIDQYSNVVPLKLPFELIDAMCDYSLVGSKFYKDGNQSLMQEAIPRVVALADAMLRKQKGKGLFDVYGPNRTRKQEYYAFRSAVCPQANKKMSISVKAYSSSQRLRGYINELVRYAENTLRALYGCRGRLRGVTLDDETATLVNAFLKKEYGSIESSQSESEKKAEIKLDFANIDRLREQSDAVRSALEVEAKVNIKEKELLTDITEVTAIFSALSPIARAFLEHLYELSWERQKETDDKAVITEVNRLAEYYLGCPLLVVEETKIIVEDDYRDELDYIYQNPPQIPTMEKCPENFDMEGLNENLKEFILRLVPEQRKALHCITAQENVQQQLEQIAEESMTMPQLLIDEINDTAIQTFGDILIDPNLRIIDEYETELKKSIV